MKSHIVSVSNYLLMGLVLTTIISGCAGHKQTKVTGNTLDSISRIPDPAARIVVLGKYIKSSPGNAELYMLLSRAYDQTGNLDSAVSNAGLAINKDTTQAAWYFYMSDLFMEKPSVKNAIGILKKLAVTQPTNKDVWVKIGALQIKTGEFDESIKNLETALKLDHNNPDAYFWLGYDFREKKENDKAIIGFEKAVELKPDYEEAYVILGLLYSDKKDPKGLEYYSSALRLNPHDTAALYDKGKYYQDIDSFQRAIDEYNKVLVLNADNRDANYGIAYCLYHLKKYDDALGYFSKVLMRNPYDAAAHYGRGLCYKGLGQPEKWRKETNIAEGLDSKKKEKPGE